MNHRKPDLLIVLIFILGLGVVVTHYGAQLLKSWDVMAAPSYAGTLIHQ